MPGERQTGIRKFALSYKNFMGWSTLSSAPTDDNIVLEEVMSEFPKLTIEPLTENPNKTNIRAQDLVSTQKRTVSISEIPDHVGVDSLLTLVCGGTVEKIEPRYKGQRLVYVEITFVYSKDAQEFYKYGQTGLFIVCGSRVNVSWSESAPADAVLEEEVNKGASRCIIVKKSSQSRSTSASKYGLNQKKRDGIDLGEIDVGDIYQDFSKYGKIVEITPAISSRLCVVIHYFDIRSAILAMKAKEDVDSWFHQKYRKWHLYHGPDPIDRPCMKV